VRAEADAENPEGRGELKITGGIQISQNTQEEYRREWRQGHR